MRTYAEETVDEEDAVDEIDLPLSQEGVSKKTYDSSIYFSIVHVHKLCYH